MIQIQQFPEMVIRHIWLVEKSNQGLNVKLMKGLSSVVPVDGDIFHILKDDDSGEYAEYHVTHRIFREVTEAGESTAMFDVVAVVIRRAVMWQPRS